MHRRQVDEIMLLLKHLMAVLLLLKLSVLLWNHRLSVFALSNLMMQLMMRLLVEKTGRLERFSVPDALNLKVSAIIGQCVTGRTAAGVQLAIFPITTQHPNGKKDE